MSICRIDAPVIYQHPLAYLLGLEGVALLRAFSGVYDRDFMSARLREIRTLLNSVEELGGGVEVRPIATREVTRIGLRSTTSPAINSSIWNSRSCARSSTAFR